MNKLIAVLVLLLVLITGLMVWQFNASGVSGKDIESVKATVRLENESLRADLQSRCDKLDKKLERIEGKLDKLIDMLTPKLADGMKMVP